MGYLIVFEGVEGCGKTTQLDRLQQWLSEKTVLEILELNTLSSTHIVRTREPGGTDLGQILREIVLGQGQFQTVHDLHNQTELLIYAADRAQHVHECLVPHLEQGHIVLCDRYTDSTIAYQGYGRGLARTLIDQLNAIATDGLQSDLTLWLDLDVEAGLARTQKRGVADRIEQSDLSFHRRVQKGFQDLAQAHPDRIVRIDASGTVDEVAAQIQGVVSDRLRQWFANR